MELMRFSRGGRGGGTIRATYEGGGIGGCGPTKAYLRLALRSAATWTFIMAGVRTRALTASRPIKPTSPRCHSAWQPDPGRGSTYRCGKSVQTTGTTSPFRRRLIHRASSNPNSCRFAAVSRPRVPTIAKIAPATIGGARPTRVTYETDGTYGQKQGGSGGVSLWGHQ